MRKSLLLFVLSTTAVLTCSREPCDAASGSGYFVKQSEAERVGGFLIEMSPHNRRAGFRSDLGLDASRASHESQDHCILEPHNGLRVSS